jgi:hypothetical protein
MPTPPPSSASYSGFNGNTHVATGSLAEVGLALKRVVGADGRPLIFSDRSGRVVDLHLGGSDDDLRQRAQAQSPVVEEKPEVPVGEVRGRGRPKLGVVAREVTLLPRHWEWLAGEPGGASVALRKLIEAARRSPEGLKRRRYERAYLFMQTMVGHEPGFEEAMRALFADEAERLRELTSRWPPDVRDHALRLAFDEGGLISPK